MMLETLKYAFASLKGFIEVFAFFTKLMIVMQIFCFQQFFLCRTKNKLCLLLCPDVDGLSQQICQLWQHTLFEEFKVDLMENFQCYRWSLIGQVWKFCWLDWWESGGVLALPYYMKALVGRAKSGTVYHYRWKFPASAGVPVPTSLFSGVLTYFQAHFLC